MPRDLPAELQEPFKTVTGRMDGAEPRHRRHREAWEGFYRQYRSYQDVKRTWRETRQPRDVDSVLRKAQGTFGTGLFIPYAFSVIETVLPRMLANPPGISVRGKKPEWEDQAEPIKVHIEAQEDEADYQLVLQDVAKSGLMYGLGVQKLPWEKVARTSKRLEPNPVPEVGEDGRPINPWVVKPFEETIYSGPRPECVDVFDFFWDPLAYSMRTMTWCVHRTWRGEKYVRDMIEHGAWKMPEGWELKDLLEPAGSERHNEVWAQRREAGFGSDGAGGAREGKVHEVWEYHDGERVVVVVNRAAPVVVAEHPFWHRELPFQIYRPTRVPHELVGIGEIESITDLIEEMNTLRTQRRDNAALVLQRPFAYFDGLVDPGDLVFGPGTAIPVDGDPRELIFPLPLQDIPASGYQEEANLSRDIERVTGIDDSLAGAGSQGGSTDTATGIQLVQAAANVRIQNKTRLLQREVVRPAARQWLRLNQQFVTEPISVIGPPDPESEDPSKDYAHWEVGPEQYAGLFLIEPLDGSMEPVNAVARAQNGLQVFQAFQGVGTVDQARLTEWALEQFGVPNPKSFVAPREPQVPLHAIETVRLLLEQMAGRDPMMVERAISDPRVWEQVVTQAVQGGSQVPPAA